jgi:ornithine carbamoyltransferase
VTRNFLSIDDLTPGDLAVLLDLSSRVKKDKGAYATALAGRSVAMIFEKPSTRTRVSFEVGIAELGGTPVVLSANDMQLGRGETVEDTGRVLSRYVDAIVLRTFEQEKLEMLADAADAAVINALSDYEHPCQTLADLLTIREHKGDLTGLTLAYLGDGNNVTHSLLLGGAMAGMNVQVATPPGYAPIPQVVHRAEELAAEHGGRILITTDPREGSTGADILYTDVWASMGQEAEAIERKLVFPAYILDTAALERANEGAIVMHCLPAHRGEEISAAAMDGPASVVFDQAENRLHTQKALLMWALTDI